MGPLGGFPNPPAKDSAGQSPAPSTRSVPRLYLITDRKATGGRTLVEVVAAALTGIAGSGLNPGDVAVQLREKDLDGRALTELGRALRAATAAAGVRLFVNDRIDVALAVGADGVHLGGTSLAPEEARGIAPELALAVSTHGIADVRTAVGDPARVAFAVFGPIRDTPSKRAFGPPLGFDALAESARIDFPLLALGGLDAGDVPEALAAGAHGVACIRSVMAATDPASAVQGLCKVLCQALATSSGRPPYRT
jgi:thiamine-phosphate pyrophosphorylase